VQRRARAWLSGVGLGAQTEVTLLNPVRLSGVALLIGACLALAVAALLAGAAGLPIGGVLAHSLLAPIGAAALACGWISATVLITLVALLPGGRIADLLAAAAIAALALALTRGAPDNDPLAVLLAPLCCLAAGVLVFRAATVLLERAERLWRRGPVLPRLALVGLARAPTAPSLAIAFIAVSTGLGGFALAYRATLLRGTADQAADQVPLDATVSPAADFTTPLQLAPLARWRAIAHGEVLPVLRTEATYAGEGATVTVPALGVPATGLAQIHGWRSSDGSAPLPILAARLRPAGAARTPGPLLHREARWLSLRLSAPAIAVIVTADLRSREGTIRQLALGAASAQPARYGSDCHGEAGSWRRSSSTSQPGSRPPTGIKTARIRRPPRNRRLRSRSDRCWRSNGQAGG
jgi:hypothetical protein